ncbi:MAG: NAD(P)-dependent oxidoreductase [Candidatus Eremiobacteraeota bacterium]|nr:NAD(P)-dependent oxidoreductase [Candidatus Eremiobacteraeota bacterium]
MSLRVAFLGLGAMGLPMARNLLCAGFPLTVWNRTPAKCDALRSEGASVAATPEEAARAADVVLVCVPSSAEVYDLLTRGDGILAGMEKGGTIVDCSTIAPTAAIEHERLCRERHVAMLEAPLSGGTAGAAAGTLTLMVAGDASVLERVRPVLSAVGKNIFYLGPPGAGQAVKLCNNLVFAAQIVAVAEAYALLLRAGIDARKATDVFLVSTADCTAVKGRVPVPGVQRAAPASNGWVPGFATEWMAKDLHLAEDFAKSLGVPVLQTALDHQMLRIAMQAGYAKMDLSVVGKMLQEWSAAATVDVSERPDGTV